MSNHSPLLQLADELIISILEQLNTRDLDSCSRVNKHIRRISAAVFIPYRLCLEKFELLHVPRSSSSISVRDLSARLEQRERNWATLTPSSMKSWFFSSCDIVTNFFDGFVIQDCGELGDGVDSQWSLDLVPLSDASEQSAVSFRTRNSRLIANDVDPMQNLLVNVERWTKTAPKTSRFQSRALHFPPRSIILRLLSISNMKHHPDCPFHLGAINISQLFPDDAVLESVSAAESLVAFSVRADQMDRLLFLNWKALSSTPIVIDFPNHLILAFRFLDPLTVLVVLLEKRPGSRLGDQTFLIPHGPLKLAVYTVHPTEPIGSPRYKLEKVFLLPKLALHAAVAIEDVVVLTGNNATRMTRSAAEHLMPHVLHELQSPSGVISITFNGKVLENEDSEDDEDEDEDDGDDWIVDMVIRTADLINLSRRVGSDILFWEEWGPNATRAFGHASSMWLGLPKIFDCHGYRVATITTFHDGDANTLTTSSIRHLRRRLEILDFSPHMTKGKALDDSRPNSSGRLVTEPSSLPHGIFEDVVSTSLPYYAAEFTSDVGRGEQPALLPESVTLTSDSLIIHVNRSDRDPEGEDEVEEEPSVRFDVYSFS